MKLYYLSLDTDKTKKVFLPLTDTMLKCQNPHVKLSSSIAGYLTLAKWGGENLADHIIDCEDGVPYIDFIKLRVYEFDVDNGHELLESQVLWKDMEIHTALMTGEYWYQDSIKPSSVYDIYLLDWQEYHTLAFSYEEEERIEAADVEENEEIGTEITVIYDLTYELA